jgi:hypothetical protein
MSSQKKKASAKATVKFKDLKAKRNPKGGSGLKIDSSNSVMKTAAWIEIT